MRSCFVALLASLFLLISAWPTVDPSELSGIINSTEVQLSLSKNDPGVTVATDEFVKGGSSLAFQAQKSGELYTFEYELNFQVAAVGVLEFQLKGVGIEPDAFVIDVLEAVEYRVGEPVDGWQRYRFSFGPSNGTVRLLLSGGVDGRANGPVGAFLDAVEFQPGLRLETRAAGLSVTIRPQKEVYALGERVEVSAKLQEGFRLGEFWTSSTSDNAVLPKVYRSSLNFSFDIEDHTEIGASNWQRLQFDGIGGWARIGGEPANKGADGAYHIESLELDPVDSGGVLSFEAKLSVDSRLNVSAGAMEGPFLSEFVSPTDMTGYKHFEFPLSFISKDLRIEHQVGRLWLHPPQFALRSLRYDRSVQAHTAIHGKGQVEVSYESLGSGGAKLARLKASPADGWVFWGWEGSVSSLRSEFELRIDRLESLTARFARVHQIGETRWSFVPQGEVDLLLSQEDGTGPLRLSVAEPVQIEAAVQLPREGIFRAKAGYGSALHGVTAEPIHFQRLDGRAWETDEVLLAPMTLVAGFSLEPLSYWELGEVDYQPIAPEAHVSLEVFAPAGAVSVSPDQGVLVKGELVTLSVNESFRPRFLGWRGDLVSDAFELEAAFERNATVQAVFRDELAETAGFKAAAQGTTLWGLAATADRAAYQSGPIQPGSWSELNFELEAPLTVRARLTSPALDTLEISAWQGRTKIATLPAGEQFIPLRWGLTGEFSILARNHGGSPASVEFEILGLYQEVLGQGVTKDKVFLQHGVVSFSKAATRDFTEDRFFFPVGEILDLSPGIGEGYRLASWNDLSLEFDQSAYTVRRDEAMVIDPVLEIDLGYPQVEVTPETLASWEYHGGVGFDSHVEEDRDEEFSMLLSGPGVVSLSIAGVVRDDVQVDVRYELDGKPVAPGEYRITEDGNDDEILVDSGLHRLTAYVSLGALGQRQDIGVRNIAFAEGYFVGTSLRDTQAFALRITPETANGLHPPGSRVSVSTVLADGASFLGWYKGPVGAEADFAYDATAHLDLHPIVPPVSRLGEVGVTFSSNAVAGFLGVVDGSHPIGSIYLQGQAGPTGVSFDVPAGTEFSFATDFGQDSDIPIRVTVDGALVFAGNAGGFPYFSRARSSGPAKVVFEADFPEGSLALATLRDIRPLKVFELYGVFGEEGKYVLAEPHKEFYNYGDEVKISLSSEAPGGFVFYDLLLSRPNLAEMEWLNVEDTRSFTLKITSETEISGRIGKMPSRAQGNIAHGSTVTLSTAAGAGPQGQSATRGQVGAYQIDYFRIVAEQSRHLTFWALLSPGQLWMLDNPGGSALPLVIEGDGIWRQISLPLAEGSRYLSALVYATSAASEIFYLSGIVPQTGFGVPFVTTGPGRVEVTPAGGTNAKGQAVTLKAAPDTEARFLDWGEAGYGPELRIQTLTGGTRLLLPLFQAEEKPLSLGGLIFDVEGSARPLMKTFEVDGFSRPALAFEGEDSEGTLVTTEVQGPARLLFSFQYGQSGSIEAVVGEERRPLTKVYSEQGVPARGEILVPAGTHRVGFGYENLFNKLDPFWIYDLTVEPGVVLEVEATQSGAVVVTPAKDFYALGETVTIAARPNDGYLFQKWSEGLKGVQSPMQVELTDHLTVKAEYISGGLESEGNLTWFGHNIPLEDWGVRFRAVTTLTGPGVLSVARHQLPFPDYKFTVDGRDATSYRDKEEVKVFIPPGRRTVELSARGAYQNISYSSSFTPGYAVLLTGDDHVVNLDPGRKSYSRGDTVLLDWAPQYGPEGGLALFLNGRDVTAEMPLALELSDHTVLRMDHLRPSGEGDFFVNADPGRVANSIGAARFSQDAQFRMQAGDDFTSSIQRSYATPGLATFSLDTLAEGCRLELYVDGQLARAIESAGTQTFRIPPAGASVRWELAYGQSQASAGTADLAAFQFQAQELSEFEEWLSGRVPSHIYATSDLIGPADDLDGDGVSNGREYDKESDPYSFELALQVGFRNSGAELDLILELPAAVAKDRVLFYEYTPGMHPLGMLWRQRALSELEPSLRSLVEGRATYTVPRSRFATDALLYKVKAEPQ